MNNGGSFMTMEFSLGIVLWTDERKKKTTNWTRIDFSIFYSFAFI